MNEDGNSLPHVEEYKASIGYGSKSSGKRSDSMIENVEKEEEVEVPPVDKMDEDGITETTMATTTNEIKRVSFAECLEQREETGEDESSDGYHSDPGEEETERIVRELQLLATLGSSFLPQEEDETSELSWEEGEFDSTDEDEDSAVEDPGKDGVEQILLEMGLADDRPEQQYFVAAAEGEAKVEVAEYQASSEEAAIENILLGIGKIPQEMITTHVEIGIEDPGEQEAVKMFKEMIDNEDDTEDPGELEVLKMMKEINIMAQVEDVLEDAERNAENASEPLVAPTKQKKVSKAVKKMMEEIDLMAEAERQQAVTDPDV